MYSLKIIIASTRPGRKGPSIGRWVYDRALLQNDFETGLIDLAEVNLPIMDEPNHPRFMNYQHEHTKKWSKLIESTDAFIIVTPEYNFSFPASVKNAIDYLYHEWSYKPVALVSYGGVAAGTRAVQMLKQVLTTLKMMPMVESVNIPFFMKFIDENEKFNAEEGLIKSADEMIRELLLWTIGLKSIREMKLQKA